MNSSTRVAKITLTFVLFLIGYLFGGFLLTTNKAEAQYGSCVEYGAMAYESGGYCKCMAGYVMGEDFLGRSQCISENQACTDQYGYNARANYSGGCTCNYGYVFGTDLFGDKKCISADSMCRDDLGVMSRYNSLSERCECSSGYVIDGGSCVNANQLCRSEHGYYSSYDSLRNSCKCDSDYVLDDDDQCVEKQNNVYFKLLDINPENDKELLIKSDYDSRKYIIRVGIGCFSTSLSVYKGKSLVVNLGTDYDVDMFDTVVLQDHNQTCSITHRERAYEDSFPESIEEDPYITPTRNIYNQNNFTPTLNISEPKKQNEVTSNIKAPVENSPQEKNYEVISDKIESSTSTTGTIAPPETQHVQVEVQENLFKRIFKFFLGWF